MILQFWDVEKKKVVTVSAENPLPMAALGGGGEGMRFLSGEGAPTSDVGAPGDVYLDTSTGDAALKA